MTARLEVRNLTRAFGGIVAVDSLSFTAERGITGLIGPNGAGKTTVFNLISGVYRPSAGSVLLDGAELSSKRPHEVVRAGVSRTFQNIRLFNRMTCLENVMIPLLARGVRGPVAALLSTAPVKDEERDARERALSIMEDVGISGVSGRPAFTLPYGLQRKLEIARALACAPNLLLLDEPAAGMNDAETRELGESIVKVQSDFDVTIVLIEHHINLVMDICGRIVVMERGALLAEGSPAEIRGDERVVAAYLGRPREKRRKLGDEPK
ncbi:MAG: ABC transporter ATP-binding protein [Synergistaceae bacterium]|jgi:ABC-type branched-subunit amino acid transport system ATPase component|nr:ABC transporter ATP-binding protein [Synergistaceae bacterium]